MDWKTKFLSRKFILAVVAGLLVILNEGLGLNIPEDAINMVVILVLGYLGIEGTADIVRAFKSNNRD